MLDTIGIVGSSLIDQTIVGSLESDGCNKVTHHFTHGGSMRNVSEHCARNSQTNMFVSIFGNDGFAEELITHLKKCLIIVFDKRVPYRTPMFTQYTSLNKKSCNIDEHFLFQDSDFLPLKHLKTCSYIITDITSVVLLEKLSQTSRVIYNGVQPTPNMLPFLSGCILSASDLTSTTEAFFASTQALDFVILTHGKHPIQYRIKNLQGEHAIPTFSHDVIGSGDAFSGAFMAKLANQGDCLEALQYAASYATSFTKAKQPE
ncbi:MAG: PfkB family carbohydrate kinase [Erysipelotrichaceae bacterium]